MSKKLALRLCAVPAFMAATGAYAAVPAGVTDALTTAGADLVTVGVALVTVMLGFWSIRKLGQKMGWW